MYCFYSDQYLCVMDPSAGPSGYHGRGGRRMRARLSRGRGLFIERGGHRVSWEEYWANRPPPPTFTDETGSPLPLDYQIPLAATWSSVYARVGGSLPSQIQANRQATPKVSNSSDPILVPIECVFCGESGHTLDFCLLRDEHDKASEAQDSAEAAIPDLDMPDLPLAVLEQPLPPVISEGPVLPIPGIDFPINISDSSTSGSASLDYTPSTPMYDVEVPSDEPLSFVPRRRFRRTGNKREYLRQFERP
jgi:hypothetical protein